MLMKEESTGDLIRIDNVNQLASPMESCVAGCRQAGQEEQDLTSYDKAGLRFPSGELLPKCWTEAKCQDL